MIENIVAVCAFCGRWRDSLRQWVEPPGIVAPLVDLKLIDLSHTYCADCLERESRNDDISQKARRVYAVQAERERERDQSVIGSDYDPDDLVHNLMVAFPPRKETAFVK